MSEMATFPSHYELSARIIEHIFSDCVDLLSYCRGSGMVLLDDYWRRYF